MEAKIGNSGEGKDQEVDKSLKGMFPNDRSSLYT